MTGWPAGTASARAAPIPADRLHPDDRADFTAAVDKALAGAGRLDAKVRLAGRGAAGERWFDVNALVLADRRGRAQRMVGVLRDISTDKGEADQLRTLVAEADHRVKNVLAAVQSLAAQSARRTMSLELFLKTFFGWLQAMAAAHTLLTATRWRGVDISHVAAAELGGLAQGQARWSGPEIVLSPRATHALTLALHELGANAVKYGALSTDAGRIDVRWRALESGGFELEWIELHGPIVSPPSHRGFGSLLLERVTGRELGGEAVLDFRPDGLRVRITGDRSALASAAEPAPQAASPPAAMLAPDGDDKPGASSGGSPAPDIRGLRVLIVEDAVLLALELESWIGRKRRQRGRNCDKTARSHAFSGRRVRRRDPRRGDPQRLPGDPRRSRSGDTRRAVHPGHRLWRIRFGLRRLRRARGAKTVQYSSDCGGLGGGRSGSGEDPAVASLRPAEDPTMLRFLIEPPERPFFPIIGRQELFPVSRIPSASAQLRRPPGRMGGDDRDPPFFFAKPADAVVPPARPFPIHRRPTTCTTRWSWWWRIGTARAPA